MRRISLFTLKAKNLNFKCCKYKSKISLSLKTQRGNIQIVSQFAPLSHVMLPQIQMAG